MLSGLLVAAILQGCSASYVTYHCQADKEFEVSYAQGDQSATLRVMNQEYPMMQVPAGSGVKYILSDKAKSSVNPIVLHTKGEHARLEIGSEVYKGCKI
ncbi:hypothetical protein GCM10007938_05740 [Vibrio zhanjiangensis]|uniref:C-type lysozyme inhibitor domain-containing protein n=2 Tax=Vibrio zhanjiangensis TaxID=1046128 RepID=A0ABQ6EUF9_9VIBR|nr:hypothetical protein GCM10007938_05740 [Vibrio zhanjiangensis]